MNNFYNGGFIDMPRKTLYSLALANNNLRTCEVEERKAIFHRWADFSEIVPPSLAVGGHNGGVIAGTMGIVEYEDGKIERVYPERIRFTDKEIKKYCFEKGQKECEKCQTIQKMIDRSKR